MIDVEKLGDYPHKASSLPFGSASSTRYEDLNKAAQTLEMGTVEREQMVRDVMNTEWYEECSKAFDVLSRDVNGNSGLALARLFADEHPELQQMWYDALNAGMMLRHKELLRIRNEEPWEGAVGHRDNMDGRVRINTAEFVVGGKDVDWR